MPPARALRVDQYLTGFAPYDAIGDHTLQVRRAFRAEGWASDIWAEEIHPPLQGEARPLAEDDAGGDGRLLLYQCSTNSGLAGWLARRAHRGDRLLMQYHNITPARYFERWHRPTALAMADARRQLAMLADRTELALAVSVYNEQELLDAGYTNTAVSPLLVDLAAYHQAPDPRLLEQLRRRRDRSGHHWLFVGRFAPNKCQHDVIGAFAAYRRLYDPEARLSLVGGKPFPRYRWALERLAHQLGVAHRVELVSGLPPARLLAYWATADVFVCMSEHEGFCVPVLEAMELGVPVVAYAAAAVPETLGGAGLLVDDKDPVGVAEVVGHACQIGPRRERLVAAGRERAASFSLEATSARLVGAVRGQAGEG